MSPGTPVRAAIHPRSSPSSAVLRITFVDVGQGDAILIQLGDFDLLVDTGPPGQWGNLDRALGSVSGALDLVVITHPHDDHYGQLVDVLRAFPVTRLITNGEPPPLNNGLAPRDWLTLEDGLRIHRLLPGQWHVGDLLTPAPGLQIRVLATGSTTGGEFPDKASGQAINNDSIVLQLTFAGRRVLLTGDIGTGGETLLLSRYCPAGPEACPELRSDVLKVPHHGSADFTPRLFDAVRPTWAVVSADYENTKHCLPRIEPLEALMKRHVALFSTSAEGPDDVVMEIKADGEITWHGPSREIFAWRKENRQCSEVRAPQGL